MIALLRRVAATGPLRRFLTRPPVERVVATFLRSSVVRERVRFLLRELPQRRVVAKYHRLGSGRPVFIRHGTPDVAALDEVFYARHYEPPPPVAALLEGRTPRVVDLGANVGLFGVFVLERFPDAELVAFEPDPANAALLHRCVEANRAGKRWRVVEAAAFTRDGEIGFASGHFTLSRIEVDGAGVQSVDVFPHLENADLVKVDIEGGEWAILADGRFERLPVPALVLEYHPHLCPEPSPREVALRTLRGAGYQVQMTLEFGPGHGMLWAWR